MTFAQVLPALLEVKFVYKREERQLWDQDVEFYYLPDGGESRLKRVAVEKKSKKKILHRSCTYALSRLDLERNDWEILEPSVFEELFL